VDRVGALDTKVSRRGFLAGTAGLTFAFTIGVGLTGGSGSASAATPGRINAWVSIAQDGTITIMAARRL
jgi:isoquinoline 1-oxidoreductase subunit beta